MFYRQSTNQYISENTSFVIDEIQYPPQWLNLSTQEDKAALGLVEVMIQGERKDPTYDWTGETLENGVLTLTATPKDLSDVKKQSIEFINALAYTILLPSDWMVVKSFETNTPMPDLWKTWRTSIRTQVYNTILNINDAFDVDGVASAVNVQWPNNPNV